MQLYSLTIFRAFAIALVVLSHSDTNGALAIDTFPEMIYWNLVSGATTLFVFISGFLFHHVFLKRFEFASFFSKKLQNLLVPYLVLSFAALAAGCAVYAIEPPPGQTGQAMLLAYVFVFGQATLAYWYIPFILTLFAMAPLHVRFTKLGARTQLIIIACLLGVAVMIHQPAVDNIGPIQNLLYYTPVYLLGIFCSQRREAIYPLVDRFVWPLLGAVIGLAVLEALDGKSGNYGKDMLELAGPDLMLIQKVCLCLFLMSFLRRFENQKSKTIDLIADTSFATFFLHPFFMQIFLEEPLVSRLNDESWARYLTTSIICLAICTGLAWWGKRVFGARSRLLTGY